MEATSSPSNDASLLVTAQFPDGGPSATLSQSCVSPEGSSVATWLCAQEQPQVGPELSEASRAALEELRENCAMLDDVDPNNKCEGTTQHYVAEFNQ